MAHRAGGVTVVSESATNYVIPVLSSSEPVYGGTINFNICSRKKKVESLNCAFRVFHDNVNRVFLVVIKFFSLGSVHHLLIAYERDSI